jgi:hypothetical protein
VGNHRGTSQGPYRRHHFGDWHHLCAQTAHRRRWE